VESVEALRADALQSWLPAPVDGGEDVALAAVGLVGVAEGAAADEDDGGADVSGAAWLVLAEAEPAAGSVPDWPAGWLGPQAVSTSARAAAAVVPISPLLIR
jgi:hypothetical protein